MVPARSARGEAGFTLLELMVVFVIGILLVFMVLPGIKGFTHQATMETVARQTSELLQLARLEAVKTNVTTNVAFDFTTNQIYAYVDADGSNIEEAGEREIGRITLPQKVYFWAAQDVSAKGTNALVNFDDNNTCYNVPKPPPIPPPARTVVACDANGIAAFKSDGSVVNSDGSTPGPDGSLAYTGPAVRFGDEYKNFLEIRIVPPAAGKIELAKWNPATSSYLLRDQGGVAWKWNS